MPHFNRVDWIRSRDEEYSETHTNTQAPPNLNTIQKKLCSKILFKWCSNVCSTIYAAYQLCEYVHKRPKYVRALCWGFWIRTTSARLKRSPSLIRNNLIPTIYENKRFILSHPFSNFHSQFTHTRSSTFCCQHYPFLRTFFSEFDVPRINECWNRSHPHIALDLRSGFQHNMPEYF